VFVWNKVQMICSQANATATPSSLVSDWSDLSGASLPRSFCKKGH